MGEASAPGGGGSVRASPEAGAAGSEAGWSNWSGSVRCTPARRAWPTDESEIVAALGRAEAEGWSLRVAGSGHSFWPLVATDGMLLDLSAHAGLEGFDPATGIARVRAGSVLRDLGAWLHERGAALHNLGDVDVQALAGALSTGTHGTGETLSNLSSRVVAMGLVVAGGEVVELAEDGDAEGLRAARVSLGALGVISTVSLRTVPAFRLHERTRRPGIDALEADLAEWIHRHRHFEFFWFPSRDLLETKSLDPTDAEPGSVEGVRFERIGWSHEILPSERPLRFNEMEYALPEEAGPACFRALRQRMLVRHGDVAWPVEYRTLAADDALLSTAHGRATVTISVHQDARLPHEALFADLEPLFWEHGGRPHWGKWHSLDAARLAPLYPEWERFAKVRERLDPQGRFLTPALRRLLGA